MASKVPKRRENGTAGTGKYATVMIRQKLKIIRRLEGNKTEVCYGFIQHWIINCL
jgi:hypothetical protein